jgi:hypothetical protein
LGVKHRLIVTAVAVVTCAAIGFAAGPKKYGKALTLKDTTKISDILAKPDAYNGKRVKVQGPIVAVCEMKGCWISLGSDKEFESIRFKVDDGVIVFPMDAKGMTATVEGTVTVAVLSEAQQIAQGEEMAKEMGKPFDPKTVKGPTTSIQIKGEAAEVF